MVGGQAERSPSSTPGHRRTLSRDKGVGIDPYASISRSSPLSPRSPSEARSTSPLGMTDGERYIPSFRRTPPSSPTSSPPPQRPAPEVEAPDPAASTAADPAAAAAAAADPAAAEPQQE